jgi:hypothetical protein
LRLQRAVTPLLKSPNLATMLTVVT